MVPSGLVAYVHGMVASVAECLCQHPGSGWGWGWGHRSIYSKGQMLVYGWGLWLGSEVHSSRVQGSV